VTPVLDAEFWTAAWDDVERRSVLRASQAAHPERWTAFYEQVADVWLELQGDPWRLGSEVTAALAAEGVVTPGSRVLDLGSGPGTMVVPLARLGAEVLAIDSSPRMTARLADAVVEQGLRGVFVRTADWTDLAATDRRDVGLAACFPPAVSARGVERLESLSRSFCVIVLGAGPEPFPFRRRIWPRLVSDPVPEVGEQLVCLVGHLLATGRRPNLRQVGWPVRLDVPASATRHFYRRYFEMLAPGLSPAEVAAAVDGGIDPFVRDGRCRADGTARAAVVWWAARGHGAP
jgi:SAM-dependent methyltransferase